MGSRLRVSVDATTLHCAVLHNTNLTLPAPCLLAEILQRLYSVHIMDQLHPPAPPAADDKTSPDLSQPIASAMLSEALWYYESVTADAADVEAMVPSTVL